MEKTLKKTLMMGFVAVVISTAFVTAGMAQQSPPAPKPAPSRQNWKNSAG